ncbi:phosphoribosyl-AMP cyclohydrolase [Oricola cellulosilytica]|uniref:Phosphoribosyl-AMP cyclohydrolase n=1 Tax=Oricola cellulosilytica TaxID=1429082 RepID=A0A4V2MNU7_9HYPH|nr:phosphoribosyl-AMP cyclohydrolase [Oricola cellulosilytica]TCD14587.1 phosphoribosyl-AMP cyclohydrolase [Oricola cellulosilytica]
MEKSPKNPFPAPGSKYELETGSVLSPRFSADGLITAVTVAAADNAVLMVAHMNAEALQLTLDTGIAHYWSRSRGEIWKKGETSGNRQAVREISIDCDQDAVVLKVETAGNGANCHTGRRSCFYRIIEKTGTGGASLAFDKNDQPRFDPDESDVQED